MLFLMAYAVVTVATIADKKPINNPVGYVNNAFFLQ